MTTLTEREEEVLGLVAAGVSTKGIAERLWLSVNTVRNHIYSIMNKLGVSSRMQAVNRWRELQEHPEERVLAYCRRNGIRLTDLQAELVRSAFTSREVECQGTAHVFPNGATNCLCGRIRVD